MTVSNPRDRDAGFRRISSATRWALGVGLAATLGLTGFFAAEAHAKSASTWPAVAPGDNQSPDDGGFGASPGGQDDGGFAGRPHTRSGGS